MRVALQYRPGVVPPEDSAANVARLWAWLDQLQHRPEHVMTIALGDHVRVSRSPSHDGVLSDFGFSVVDVDEIDQAIALTHGWPEFQWGGAIDVRPAVTP